MLPIGAGLQMGKYRIDRYLASGGFGNTYVVTNTQFDEQFALKEFFMRGISHRESDQTTVSVSNSDNAQQFTQQRDKFKKEARRLRKLRNEHIVQVHDLFDENGTAYYIMDLIDGEALSARIKRTGKPLDEQEATAILTQVLDALDTVHQQGIWHLDLKPGNIMVDGTGRAVLIDFGASKQMSSGDGMTTTTTAMAYTPGYAPTEQIDQTLELIGPWTDLYALGATLYHLLTTNRPPRVSEVQESGAFTFPTAVSAKMRHLVRWLMQPSRQKRPQSVAEVRTFLSEPFVEPPVVEEDDDTIVEVDVAVTDDTVGKVGLDSHSQASKPVASSSARRWVIAAVVLGVLAGIGLMFTLQKKETPVIIENADGVATASGMYFKSSLGTGAYTGPVNEKNEPNGQGVLNFENGDVYTGKFVNGQLTDDAAEIRFANGERYNGKIDNGHFTYGTYTFTEGDTFVGTFRADNLPDKGTWK